MACPTSWHHGTVRLRTLIPVTAALGAAAVGYATVIERNWFALRRYEVPVLPPGAAPLRVLHISDTHLTPGRKRLMAWVRALDELDPHLVVNTGDSISHPQVDPVLSRRPRAAPGPARRLRARLQRHVRARATQPGALPDGAELSLAASGRNPTCPGRSSATT